MKIDWKINDFKIGSYCEDSGIMERLRVFRQIIAFEIYERSQGRAGRAETAETCFSIVKF